MEALKQLRSRFNSQKEMADAIGVEQGTISDWLSGKKKPSIENCKTIESVFKIPRTEIRPDIYK